MKEIALTLPGGEQIETPPNIPQGSGTVENVVVGSFSLLLLASIFLALIFMIIGGIKWTTSQGDKTKIESARKTVVFSIVGLVVVMLSFAIIRIIGGLLGIEYLRIFGI